MNTQECCNHNCNQGRDCPLRKETLDTRSYLIGRYDAIKTNNEPVAWIAVGDNTSVFFDLDCALAIDDNPTPLYTHPAKTLTDVEITELFYPFDLNDEAWVEDAVLLKFARAILRKAQKK